MRTSRYVRENCWFCLGLTHNGHQEKGVKYGSDKVAPPPPPCFFFFLVIGDAFGGKDA